MSLFDDLKKTLARRAAEQTAATAARRAEAAVQSFADDFLGAAEGALERAEAEQGRREARLEAAEDQGWSLHQERLDRKARAREELARLKAARTTDD